MLTKWVSLINLRVINPVFDELGRKRRVLKQWRTYHGAWGGGHGPPQFLKKYILVYKFTQNFSSWLLIFILSPLPTKVLQIDKWNEKKKLLTFPFGQLFQECKVVIYNIVFCWLIFRAKFDSNVIQSFVPCIYCGISL